MRLTLLAFTLLSPVFLFGQHPKELLEAYRQRDRKKLGELLEQIGRKGGRRDVRLVLKVLKKTVNWEECYEGAKKGLSQVQSKEGKREIRRALLSSSTPWKVRLLLLEVVDTWERQEKIPLFLKLLKGKKRPFLAQVIRNLAKEGEGNREVIDRLIQFMMKRDKKQDRLWEECQRALEHLLGVRQPSGASYKSWVEIRGYQKVSQKVKASPATVVRSFFGVPVRCKRSVFIIDVSGSMKTIDPLPPSLHGGTTLRGEEPKLDPERMRIRRAKKELIKVIQSLQSDQYFNVIAYSSDVWVWSKKGCLKATEKNKRSAIEFVKKFKAEGVTVTDLALARAYEINPRAECFYLLSDGAPTRDGQNIIPTEEILELVLKYDRFRKVRIYTLGFPGAPQDFMRALANLTGGLYRDIQ